MMKKKTQAQGATVSHCNFIGVQYDAKAVDVIATIAQGLVENAQALGHLAQVLKASNVTIDALVRVDAGPTISTK